MGRDVRLHDLLPPARVRRGRSGRGEAAGGTGQAPHSRDHARDRADHAGVGDVAVSATVGRVDRRAALKTPMGLAFGLGGLAALLAFVVGIGLARPFMMRSMKLAEQMKTASPADRNSIMAEMQKLGARGAVVNRLVMALLLFALAAMAVARYL